VQHLARKVRELKWNACIVDRQTDRRTAFQIDYTNIP